MIHTGIGPFDIDRGTFLAYGKVNYSQRRDAGQRVRQPSRRRAPPTCLSRRRRPARSSRSSSRTRPSTSRPSDVRTWRNRHVFSSAATSATTASTCRWRRSAIRARRPASTARTRSSSSERCRRWVVGGRVDTFSSLDGAGVLAAHDVHVQAGAGADGARVVQPRLSRAVARQQLPRHDARSTARSRRPQPGPGRPAVHLPRRCRRQRRT